MILTFYIAKKYLYMKEKKCIIIVFFLFFKKVKNL